MIRTRVYQEMERAVKKVYPAAVSPEFSLVVPENQAHGDYATNLALMLASTLKKSPMEVAGAIAEELRTRSQEFDKVEAVPPGFINVWVSREALYRECAEILKRKTSYAKLSRLNLNSSQAGSRAERINIEFISANPTGPLTIGNGRGAFFGDTLARVLAYAGKKVIREYYINDARASTQIQELGKTILGKGDSYPGQYTDAIRMRLQRHFPALKKMSAENAGYAAAQENQKDNSAFIGKILKIKFDVWYSEEKLYTGGLIEKTVETLKEKDAMYEKDGATWFRASQFGDSEDRVAIRTGGAPTYFLPDVAYHAEKLGVRKFDRVIDILGADHHGTFPRVLAGLRALGIEAERVSPIFCQIALLTRQGREVKMSKRRGEYVTLKELIEEVGVDAARYFFLEKSPDTHMDFDLDLAKEQSVKNPVYYIQYAHARIAAIFRKAKNQDFRFSSPGILLLTEPEEVFLIKKLIQFPEIIEDTARDYQVHRLPRYALELARLFHHFYAKHRVITEDEKLSEARLALARATQIVLQGVLGLMCISAPEKM